MKIIGYVSTNRVGSKVQFEVDVDETELEGMEPAERDDYIEDVAKQAMSDCIEWSYEIVT